MMGDMREIDAIDAKDAKDAKDNLSALLDLVIRGEEVVITRDGKPIAHVVPVVPRFDRAKARQAARGLLDTHCDATLGGISLKALVNEGRP